VFSFSINWCLFEGYLSIKLAKLGAQVTGIDLSPEMIKFAKENAATAFSSESLHSVTAPSFSVCSIEDMQPLEDKSFDRIVSNYVLQDTPNLEKTVKVC
jgi:2-polyprenyl-6-hydroxyphenyl methylase/3-demethylubiquinone-9 3-methyltransferase